MGYLPEFEDDVFISYAHNDNLPFVGEREGWVDQFHDELKKHVHQLLGQEPSLWRDCEIRGNDDFVEKIFNRLAKTATLLSVVTENFLKHEWFQRELDEFCRNAEGRIGLRVGEKRRIFKVFRNEIKREALPKQFAGMKSYEFYGEDPYDPKKRVHEYRPSLGEQQRHLFYLEINDLAIDIVRTLEEMKKMGPGAMKKASKSGTVYLAETSTDQKTARASIKRELQDRGVIVLPEGDLPRGDEFEQCVSECLQKSDLSIHMFGNRSGFVPEGSKCPHTWLQHDLAMQRANDPDFFRFLCLPSALVSTDEDQRRYIQKLQSDAAVQRGAEILQDDRVEGLKTEVLHSLDQIRSKREERSRTSLPKPLPTPMPNPVRKASDEPLSVYIICDPRDLQSPAFLSLNSLLFDHGYEPLKSLVVDTAEEARRTHEEYLQFCDACVIYYGAASAGWVTSKLNDFLKFRSKRQTPFLSKAVYVAPPASEAKRGFLTHLAKVIQGGPEFSPEELSPFLDMLRRP
jgi:TIR domain-containing protein